MKKKILLVGMLLCLMGLIMFTGMGWAQEKYRIQVLNQTGGDIRISEDGGVTWNKQGQVIIPATKLNEGGFAAAAYGQIGKVTATAVNSVHIKVNQRGEKPVLFSLVPKETIDPGFSTNSYFSSSSSIFTDIPAGTGIFGGGYAPFVGSQVLAGEEMEPLDNNYSPQIGDLLTIVVERTNPYPAQIIIENKAGGKVKARYLNGEIKEIAQVLSPVGGTGRFEGSVYSEVGRIRANHPGVICISTSPIGQIGGFQIIPSNHSYSSSVWGQPQWMVVGPLAEQAFLAGTPPLFAEFIQPRYLKDQWLANFLVDVKIKDGPWQPMPRVVGLDNQSLKDVTQIRILFPLR